MQILFNFRPAGANTGVKKGGFEIAKLIMQVNGLKIKETGPLDRSTYKYLITTVDGAPEWECDLFDEAAEWVVNYTK